MSDFVELAEAAKLCPGRPHASTLWRWARRGIKARNGQRIRLRHLRAGAKIYVRPSDIEEFFGEIARADGEHFQSGNGTPRPVDTPTTGRSQKRTEEVLRGAGIL